MTPPCVRVAWSASPDDAAQGAGPVPPDRPRPLPPPRNVPRTGFSQIRGFQGARRHATSREALHGRIAFRSA